MVAKILLMSDSPQTLIIAEKTVRELGYECYTVSSADEALDMLTQLKPAAAILDFTISRGDAYRVREHLREFGTRTIGIVPQGASDEEIFAELELDAILEKPITEEKVKEVLRNLVAVSEKELADSAKVNLLRKLLEENLQELSPEPCPTSPIGHTYPFVRELLSINPGEEVELLEDLADRGCLERELFDKIHLCPFCMHYNLNFRELCPNCRSVDIAITELIHHFRCAYVGPESEFQKGDKYICPKCGEQLRHIGVDYEKPSETYYCASCGYAFTEPELNCLCLHCQKIFPPENCLLHPIYKYTITDAGVRAAEQGYLEEPSVENVLLDPQVGLFQLSYFKERLNENFKRAIRYNHPLTVAALRVANYDELAAEKGRATAAEILRQFARCLRENIRDVDIPARYNKDTFVLLLPETDEKGADVALDRIKKHIQQIEPSVVIKSARYAISQKLNAPEALLEAAVSGCR